MIRIPQVRVVDEEGAQLGVMPTPRALEMAQERGLDLVEVAPMASPPVVKFLDFGQYKYELTKREKEAKRKQRSVTFKEVRLKPKIGIGDFDTKVRRAIEFLEDGDRIKKSIEVGVPISIAYGQWTRSATTCSVPGTPPTSRPASRVSSDGCGHSDCTRCSWRKSRPYDTPATLPGRRERHRRATGRRPRRGL